MWAAQRSTASLPTRHDNIFLDLADALNNIPAPKVLSFGCSKGFEPLDLARLIPNATVLGCDVEPKALIEAKGRCEQAGIRIFESNAETLREFGPYDAITAMNVLTRYPTVQDRDDISGIYPFSAFDQVVHSIVDQIKPGGLLRALQFLLPI